MGMARGDTEDAECAICRAYCHLSAVECDCCPGRRTCLRHAPNLCDCPPSSHRLAWRTSLHSLHTLAAAVAARAPAGTNTLLLMSCDVCLHITIFSRRLSMEDLDLEEDFLS